MATPRQRRQIHWLNAAHRDFRDFPPDTRDKFEEALDVVASGGFPQIAKPLSGLGSGVVELALPFRGDAFRVVYTLIIGTEIWVVHAFQKKSTHGIATPKRDMETIRQRLGRLRTMPH